MAAAPLRASAAARGDAPGAMKLGVPIVLFPSCVTSPRSPILMPLPCAVMKMLSHFMSRWISGRFPSVAGAPSSAGRTGSSECRYERHSRMSLQ